MNYDEVKLGLIDRLKVWNARRMTKKQTRQISRKYNEGQFVDFSEADELEENLLNQKKLKIATRDARKLFKSAYGKDNDGLGEADFINYYLMDNGIIPKVLSEPEKMEKAPVVEEKDFKTLEFMGLQSKDAIQKDLYNIKTVEGQTGIEYYNHRNSLAKGYDTTRLILGNEKEIQGKKLRECLVSWYNADKVLENTIKRREGKFYGEFNSYTQIFAEINLNLLVTNPEYSAKVMNDLLDKSRVEKYIERGLQEAPDVYTGRYVGGVARTNDGGYIKTFNRDIGKATYNLPENKKRREERKKEIEAYKRIELQQAEDKVRKIKQELKQRER